MRTLILNADYSPLNMVHVNRGIVLSFKQNIKVLKCYDIEYRYEHGSLKIPAVLLYANYINRPYIEKPSRRGILLRDRLECQYCGIKLNKNNLSVDHIKPVAFFKKREQSNTWDNMVACCRQCNFKKSKRTPEQAGMRLLSKPKAPRNFLLNEVIPEEWKFFVKTFNHENQIYETAISFCT